MSISKSSRSLSRLEDVRTLRRSTAAEGEKMCYLRDFLSGGGARSLVGIF